MKKDIEQSLDAIFSSHEDSVRRAKEAQTLAEEQKQEFISAFVDLRANVIRPALEEVKSYLEAKGYRCAISQMEEQESSQRFASSTRASVELTIFPGETNGRDPHFSVICDKHAKKVFFHENTVWGSRGGHTGGAGEYSLNQITSDLVHEKALQWLKSVFSYR